MGEVLPLPVLQLAHAVLCLVVLGSAVAVITRRNPVAAVAWLVVHFVATACLYLVLRAQFVAAVQVLVYAGAIIVLFLFVIMLLRVDRQPEAVADSGLGRKVLVAVAGAALLGGFCFVALRAGPLALESSGTPLKDQDSVEWLARSLFEGHLVAFELASVVLVAAMAGVLVLTTRRVKGGGEA